MSGGGERERWDVMSFGCGLLEVVLICSLGDAIQICLLAALDTYVGLGREHGQPNRLGGATSYCGLWVSRDAG
jgi:hypothetical protein